MRKKLVIYMACCITAITGFVLLACGMGESGRYYNSEYHFSIKFPSGCHIDVDPDGNSVSAWGDFANDNDMYEENMTITYEELESKTGLESYFTEVNYNTGRDLANFRIENQGAITLDGQPARAIRSSFTMAEGNLKMLGWCTIKDKHALTIACIMEPGNYTKYQPIFKEAVHSLRFE